MVTNERGLVSLITVSFMALLMMTIALSMSRLMVGEMRQATDSEDSIKAYYSAQGAAEYQAQKIRTALKNDPSLTGLNGQNRGCGTPIDPPLPNINCIKVETSADTVDSQLAAERFASFDLSQSVVTESDNISKIRLAWDDLDAREPYADPFSDPGDCNGKGLCGWQSGATGQPPVMELTVANYFPGQNTNLDENNSGTVVLNPRSITPSYAGSCRPAAGSDPPQFDLANCLVVKGNNPVMQVKCQGSKYARCQVEIKNIAPAGYRTVITLKSRLRGSRYTLSAISSNIWGRTCPVSGTVQTECQVPVALDRARIDVTASIGQAYRRIIMSVPIRAIPSTPGLVLEGDSDVCKSFDVYSSGAGEFARVTTLPGAPPCYIGN